MFYACLFLFVEVKTQQISFILIIVVQILRKLFLTPFVVLISMPDFEFDNKLLAKIVHDNVCAPLVPRLCLDIIIPCPVDDWS